MNEFFFHKRMYICPYVCVVPQLCVSHHISDSLTATVYIKQERAVIVSYILELNFSTNAEA